jgi:SAM-dependent methyltransferase
MTPDVPSSRRDIDVTGAASTPGPRQVDGTGNGVPPVRPTDGEPHDEPGSAVGAAVSLEGASVGGGDDRREARLKRWVRQPPASPNVQYLRDAEHEAALRLLGRCERVLDVASESTVTERIAADEVTRVDFSSAASSYARELVGDRVAAYGVADPAAPRLPLADDSVDGVICVGPYDWQFLDVSALTAEIERVCRPGGRVVVSVPTPRSPYARTGKSRTYTPAAARDLLGTGFRLLGMESIFQYPGPAHTAVNRLPHAAQRPFVALANGLTAGLTALDERTPLDGAAVASYLVVAATPMDYRGALREGLRALFRPVDAPRPGFFDPTLGEAGAITRALTYELVDDATGRGEGGVRWAHDGANEWRYAPFTLAGVLRWRVSAVGVGDDHDERLRATLDYFATQVADEEALTSMPTYGTGPLLAAFVLATTLEAFADVRDRYADVARTLFEHTSRTVTFDDAEDSLVLWGWSWYADALAPRDDDGEGHAGDPSPATGGIGSRDDGRSPYAAVLAEVERGRDAVMARRSAEGLFAFDNPTSRRHQNQMYTCWGLAKAIEVTGRRDLLSAIEGVLDHTVRRRMRADGAFVWEDLPRGRRLLDAVHERRTGHTAYWRYLYECHQTFFVNAVAAYYAAGGRRDYDGPVRRAMAWIFGDNALGRSLVEVAGIGVPMRQLTTDGRLDSRQFVGGVRDQQYKGTYEVGSYVMALTHLLDGTIQ